MDPLICIAQLKHGSSWMKGTKQTTFRIWSFCNSLEIVGKIVCVICRLYEGFRTPWKTEVSGSCLPLVCTQGSGGVLWHLLPQLWEVPALWLHPFLLLTSGASEHAPWHFWKMNAS